MISDSTNSLKILYKAILNIKNERECELFFKDICTPQELEAIAQRLDVAIKLQNGESYIDINKETGASTATISRVSKYLNSGDYGYITVIERLEKDGII